MSLLNICIWNANGVNQHKLEIIRFLSEKNIDVMLISETHLTNKNNFNIPGFRVYVTNHPDGKAHGGTAVLIRNRLNHYSLEQWFPNLFCLPLSLRINIFLAPPFFHLFKNHYNFKLIIVTYICILTENSKRHFYYNQQLET